MTSRPLQVRHKTTGKVQIYYLLSLLPSSGSTLFFLSESIVIKLSNDQSVLSHLFIQRIQI